uniref:Membrane protein n=1 Tax=Streptomyces olivaceus TaxID=47716 RepID=A8KQT8_STROV|nr:membrane protein [Streptomyces olivaceus]
MTTTRRLTEAEWRTVQEETAPAPPPRSSEGARERVNRRWQEVLQETRVAQTGVQILFGFLLSLAFTPRFRELGSFDRGLYVVTVVLAASSTAALIAPVTLHRCLSGQRLKDEVVTAAGRLMVCGIVLLALTVACTLMLILNVVLGGVLPAGIVVGGVMLWFALCWYGAAYRVRRRAQQRIRER